MVKDKLEEIVTKKYELEDKFVDNLFYPNETLLERHARHQEEKDFYGSGLERLATIYIPGVYFYKSVQDAKKRGVITSDSSLGRKAVVYAFCVGNELFLDAIKIGFGYGLYAWCKWLGE